MRDTKKQMRDILRQDVQVSDVVNQRLCDTYKILERKQESSGKRKYYGKNPFEKGKQSFQESACRGGSGSNRLPYGAKRCVCVGESGIFRGNVWKYDEEILGRRP